MQPWRFYGFAPETSRTKPSWSTAHHSHRAGTFDPKLIAKYQRRFPEFDDKIISMYARGMSVREIHGHPPDGFIRDDDPTLKQHFLKLSQVQAEPVVEPYGIGDDLGKRWFLYVAAGSLIHPT